MLEDDDGDENLSFKPATERDGIYGWLLGFLCAALSSGTTDGTEKAALGVCGALFCCCCCCCGGGRGWETEQTASQRTAISASLAIPVRVGRRLCKATAAQRRRPSFRPCMLTVPYVLTSTGWHRTLCAGSPVSWLLLLHHARLALVAEIVICRRRCSRGWGRGAPRYQELESEEYIDSLPWPPWFPTPMSPSTPVEMLISRQEAVDQDLDPKPGSRRQMPSLSLRVRSALLMLRLHAIRSRVPPMLELVLLAKPTCGFSEPSMRRFRNGACRAKPPSTRP